MQRVTNLHIVTKKVITKRIEKNLKWSKLASGFFAFLLPTKFVVFQSSGWRGKLSWTSSQLAIGSPLPNADLNSEDCVSKRFSSAIFRNAKTLWNCLLNTSGLNISTRHQTVSGKKSSFLRRRLLYNEHSCSVWNLKYNYKLSTP